MHKDLCVCIKSMTINVLLLSLKCISCPSKVFGSFRILLSQQNSMVF
jgi:hypothetical protein